MRMLRVCAFLMALVVLPYLGQAQSPTFRVDISEQLLMLPNLPPFDVVRVVDLRENPFTTGWVPRGPKHTSVPSDLRDGAAVALQSWIRRRLPARPLARPVVMRIHDLTIEESPSGQGATAAVDVDFLAQRPDSVYYVVLRKAEIVTPRVVPTESVHATNLATCFQRIFLALNTANLDQPQPGTAPVPPHQVLYRNGRPREIKEEYQYPIVTESPKRGLYPDFLAFRRNQPLVDVPFVAEPLATGGWRLAETKLPGADRHPPRTYWGFCDGRWLYIRMNNRYWPLSHAGQYFAFTGAAGADKDVVAASAAVGGLIGAAIAAAVTDDGLQSYTLDLATGRIADYAYLDRLAEADTAVVYLYRRFNAGPDAPVPVMLDGKPIGELGRDALLRMPWTSKTRELTLSLAGSESASFRLIPSFTEVTYCEVTATADDPSQLQIKRASTTDGEHYVPRIQQRMKKR